MSANFDEKLFKIQAELDAQNKEFSDLRNILFKITSSKSEYTFKKKIESAESLWIIVQKLSKLSLAVEVMKCINYETISEESNNAKINQMFSHLNNAININDSLKEFSNYQITKEQLYVSDTIWVYFSVYMAIIFDAVLRLKALEFGLEATKFIKDNTLGPMLIELYPSSKDLIDEFGDAHAYFWLDKIREDLLKHLKSFIEGEEGVEIEASKLEKIARYARSYSSRISLGDLNLFDG